MNKPISQLLLTVFLAVFILTGCCAEPAQTTAGKICPAVDKHQAFSAAQHIIEDMYFVIDKADEEQGFISTRPLGAAQFFEFWRSDTVGSYNFAESNMQSITRIAEITITPNGHNVCIDCTVKVRRLSLPQRQANFATEVPCLFTKSDESLQRLRLNKDQKKDTRWVDMGPDARLQARILDRINKRLAKKMKGKK